MPYQISPALPPEMHVKIYRGDTWTIDVDHNETVPGVTDAWLQVRDPENYTLYVDIRQSVKPAQWNAGLTVVTLLPADTNVFTRAGTYLYDVQFTLSSGVVKTVQRGQFELTKDVVTSLAGGGTPPAEYVSLTVEETDGAPSGVPATMKMPKGTLTPVGDVFTYAPRVAFAWHVVENLAVQDEYGPIYPLDRAVTITEVILTSKVGPVGAAAIFDVEWAVDSDGPWTTIFSTKPQIAAGARDGGSAAVLSVTSLVAGSRIRMNIDQIGSTTPGAGITLLLSGKEA